MMLGVNLFGKCPLIRSGHVIGDGREICRLAETRHNFLSNRLVAGIDMMEMDRGGVRRLLLPKMGDGASQEPQHSAHSLKVAEGRGLGRQGSQHLRVQRVARQKRLGRLGAGRIARQGFTAAGPELAVGGDDRSRPGFIDGLEQAPTQHLRRLVFFRGVEQGRLACGDALSLRHAVGNELVLRSVGVGSAAVLADGESVDQGRIGRTLHGLEQGRQEGCQLVVGIIELSHFAQVHRKLVEQDQGGFTSEQFPQGLGTRRDPMLVALTNPFVSVRSGKSVGDLAPGCAGQHAVAHRPPVGGVRVFAVEGRDTDWALWEESRFNELRSIRHVRHAPGRVRKRDEAMSFAAPV